MTISPAISRARIDVGRNQCVLMTRTSSVGDRRHSVVTPWDVAAGSAAAARLRLLVVRRDLPPPERHRLPDLLRPLRGVGLVARPARASLVGAIDVDEVEVLLTVAEVGQLRGGGLEGERG